MLSTLRSFFRTDFEYSPWHRLVEIVGIFAALGLMAVIAFRAAVGLAGVGWQTALWLLPTAAVTGYLLADFASGFVHWLGDTYGSNDTPILGDTFIQPFRDHHVEPKGILQHDFVEVNGNNSVVNALTGLPIVLIFNDPTVFAHLVVLIVALFLLAGAFMTNQFHRWSHMDDPGPVIARLQEWGLILGRHHHDVHHTAPYDTYYCITCGWLNPVLSRIQFFETLERIIRRTIGWRTSREENQPT